MPCCDALGHWVHCVWDSLILLASPFFGMRPSMVLLYSRIARMSIAVPCFPSRLQNLQTERLEGQTNAETLPNQAEASDQIDSPGIAQIWPVLCPAPHAAADHSLCCGVSGDVSRVTLATGSVWLKLQQAWLHHWVRCQCRVCMRNCDTGLLLCGDGPNKPSSACGSVFRNVSPR